MLWSPGDPTVPGWYAVSTVVEQVVPAVLKAPRDQLHGDDFIRGLADEYAAALARVAQGEDFGYHAGTSHVFRVGPQATEGGTPANPSGN